MFFMYLLIVLSFFFFHYSLSSICVVMVQMAETVYDSWIELPNMNMMQMTCSRESTFISYLIELLFGRMSP